MNETQQQQQQQPTTTSGEWSSNREEAHSRRSDHWHFEKRLSLDTVVAIVGISIVLGGPIFYWARGQDQRTQTLEIKEEARARQEGERAKDLRDSQITMLSNMDVLKEQVTQLRIDVGQLLKGGQTSIITIPQAVQPARRR